MWYICLFVFVVNRKSREAHKAVLDEKDKKYYSHLVKARTLARYVASFIVNCSSF